MASKGIVMKKDRKEILDNYVPDVPGKFAYFLYRTALFFVNLRKKVRYIYNFDKKEMKNRQVLILSDHNSTDSYMYMSQGYGFCNPNIVMGYQNILTKGIFTLLLKIGIIPKKLYVTDMSAIKNILRLVKKGCSIALLPEGIQSSAGYSMPIYPGTAALIKRCNLDCVICKTDGSYLNRPRFDKNYRYGNIEVTFDILFTKEETQSLSEEEIDSVLKDKMAYNDFIWNKEKRYKYKGKYPNSHNIERILYHCPVCGSDFTLSSSSGKLKCTCGLECEIDEYYDLKTNTPGFPYKRIDEWFTGERNIVHIETEKDDFSMEYDCIYYDIDYVNLSGDSVKEKGRGKVILNKKALVYNGECEGKNVEYVFDLRQIISAPFVSGTANEFYYNGKYYRFAPLCKESISLKVMLAIEEIHNREDSLWRKALNDSLAEGKQV